MASVGIRELRAHTSEILRRVEERGETLDVTHHGRVVARLVPVVSPGDDVDSVRVHLDELDRIATMIGSAWPEGVSAVDAVHEQRRDL